MLEVRVVSLDGVDLRAFRISFVLDRPPGSCTRRAVPRLQRCRHMLGAGRVVREGLEGQRRVDRIVADPLGPVAWSYIDEPGVWVDWLETRFSFGCPSGSPP